MQILENGGRDYDFNIRIIEWLICIIFKVDDSLRNYSINIPHPCGNTLDMDCSYHILLTTYSAEHFLN